MNKEYLNYLKLQKFEFYSLLAICILSVIALPYIENQMRKSNQASHELNRSMALDNCKGLVELNKRIGINSVCTPNGSVVNLTSDN